MERQGTTKGAENYNFISIDKDRNEEARINNSMK